MYSKANVTHLHYSDYDFREKMLVWSRRLRLLGVQTRSLSTVHSETERIGKGSSGMLTDLLQLIATVFDVTIRREVDS